MSAETSNARVLPKTDLEWIAYALADAATALPVLFTMLTKIGAKDGAMVADEILGHVRSAQKNCARLVEHERQAHEPPASQEPMGWARVFPDGRHEVSHGKWREPDRHERWTVVPLYRHAPPPSAALTDQELHAIWNAQAAAYDGFVWTDATGRRLLRDLYERHRPAQTKVVST